MTPAPEKQSVSHPAPNPLPYVGDYRTVCIDIPNTQAHFSQLSKWLYPMTLWTNFVRTGDNQGSVSAKEWTQSWLSMRWCDMVQIRSTPDCGLEYSNDGGNTWELVRLNCVPDVPGSIFNLSIALNQNYTTLQEYIRDYDVNGGGTITQGWTGTPSGDDALAICLASNYFVASWCQLKVAELDQAFLLGAVGLALFAMLTGGLGLLFGLAVGGAALVGGLTYSVARAALVDETAQRDVACALADQINSRAISLTNWRIAWQSISFGTGTNQQIIIDFMKPQFDTVNSSGRVGQRVLLKAATTILTKPGSPLCPCADWCVETVPEPAFLNITPTYGHWDSGARDYIIGDLEPTNQVTMWSEVVFTWGIEIFITEVEFEINYVGTNTTRRSAVWSPGYSDRTAGHYFDVPGTTGVHVVTVPVNKWLSTIAITAATVAGQEVRLQGAKISGWTPNPFGQSNC